MTCVVVIGRSVRAGEWATRFLAAGRDVVVESEEVATTVHGCWPIAERLGLFPGASRSRLRVGVDEATVARADLVQVVEGTPPAGATLVANESTARGCSPVHVVPLVEVDGPDAEALARRYESIGMAPRTADDDAEERWLLGEGLTRLAGNDAGTVLALMRALRATAAPAGLALAHHEAMRFAAAARAPWRRGEVPEAPLRLYRTPVEPEWVDYNGHMTESAYLTAAGWASDALFRYIGDDEAYRAAGHSFYTVETHIHYLREVAVHEPIEFTTQVLGLDAKRVHLIHTMHHGADGTVVCTAEQMLVHVDMVAGRSTAILPDVAAALSAIADAHTHLPVPEQVGSVMRLPPPRV